MRWLCLIASLAATATTVRAEPISLRVAVDTALRQHPTLAADAADRDSLAARVGHTRAALLPRVSTSGSTRDDYYDPINFASSTPVGFSNKAVYNLGVNVNQLVTDRGLTAYQVEGAEALERQANAQIAVDRLDIELGVVQAYLDVLRSKDLAAVSTGAISLVQEQLDRATKLFGLTLRPEIDVLSAKTQLAQAELARLRDENAVAVAQVTLANAIGATNAAPVDALPLDVRALPEETRSLAELSNISFGARAELAVQRDALDAIEAAAGVARKRTAPVVSVQSGVYANATYAKGAPTSWVPGLGVFATLTVSMDLYVGDANRYELEDARAQARSARAQLEHIQQSITLSVGRASLAVQLARDSLDVATAWRTNAERQLHLAQSRYDSGVGSFVELNDARSGLVAAQRQEVLARYDLARNRAALARELGRSPAGVAVQP